MKLELNALTPAAVRKMQSNIHGEKRDVMNRCLLDGLNDSLGG
jgi:hypothetical protein